MSTRGRVAGDEGASLILVLVFILSFALIVPALLTLTRTSVASVAPLRDVSNRSLDATSAVETAINRLRNGSYYNAPSQTCFHDPADVTGATDSSAVVVDGANTGQKVLVTCQAEPATGYPTSVRVPFTGINTPGSALLTLSRASGEDGILHDKNNVLRVQGRVFSNSTIKVSNPGAELRGTNAPIYARGACTGTVLGNPTSCSDTSHDSLGADPGYTLPTAVPPPATAPACTASKTYSLDPGTYTSAAALSSLTSSSCGSPLLHFRPGIYYFDFANSDPVWSVSSGYVIAGRPASGARAWTMAAYPGTPPPVPGACIAPTEVAAGSTNDGVQFIFGAASRMTISGGAKVEICGQYSETSPPIAVFGANAGAISPPVLRTITLTGARSTGNPSFANPNQISDRDGQTANAKLLGKVGGSATIDGTFSGLFPAGSRLVSANLRFVHRDLVGPADTQGSTTYPAGRVSGLAITLVPLKSGGGLANPAISPVTAITPGADAPAAAPREDVLDFTDALRPYFESPTFTGADVGLVASATAAQAATEQVDSIHLDLTYSVPAFQAENGCVSATPYGSSGTCALLSSNNNSSNALYIQGTTYAPRAALDINLNNVSEQVFRFGLVARTVRLAITGSSTFADAVIAVPDISPGFSTTVPMAANLQVFICEGGGCAAPATPTPPGYVPAAGSGWVRRLSTRVRVTDEAYPPTAARRQVDVESWFHVR